MFFRSLVYHTSMATIPVITAPHHILTTAAEAVPAVNEEVRQLVTDLKDTLINHSDPEGVGIAAPQIGVSKRVFVVRDDEESNLITAFINPTISLFSPESYVDANPEDKHIMEGCLSIPGIYGKVTRSNAITIEYLNEEGEEMKESIAGLQATYIQHEFDHIDGILFTERAIAEGNQLYKIEGDEWIPVKV